MNDETALLLDIQQHWKKNKPAQLEMGVWVAWHEPISEADMHPQSPVCKAWLVTDRLIEQRPTTSYKIFAENKLQVSASELHEMGEATIAPYANSNLYYIAFQMGPLHGGAMKASIENGKVKSKGRLWSA